MKKTKWSYAIIIIIGVIGMGVGGSNAWTYITGGGIAFWLGEVPMAFSTAIIVFLFGLAFYIIGKWLKAHDKVKG